MSRFNYTGRRTDQISFPLGGIGTGCIGLAGNGRLIDWEIFNKPNKGSINGFSHFAVKAEAEGQLLDARVLHGDLHPPYIGEFSSQQYSGYGFGPRREYLTGMPHFRAVEFGGDFPLAELSFVDDRFPADIKLRAFNPFIPLNDVDSGIPAAFFEIEVTNTSDRTVTYAIVGVLSNPLAGRNVHTAESNELGTLLHLASDTVDPSNMQYGNLTLMTDSEDVSWQQYWFRGAWFDNLEVYWRDFAKPGKIQNRVYPIEVAGQQNTAMLAAHVTLAPNETRSVRFLISWSFPNCENYWSDRRCSDNDCCPSALGWKNHYATLWKDSRDSALYAFQHWERLQADASSTNTPQWETDLISPAASVVESAHAILPDCADVNRWW